MKSLLSILLLLLLIGCSAPQKKADQESIKKQRIADSMLVVETNQKLTEQKEKLRIAKESSLGIWYTNYYTDEFGDKTKDGFIGTVLPGVFSNSATEDADLNVKFLISNPSDISIMLYEYAGTNPVKSGVERGYSIRIKQDSLPPVDLFAQNYSDRLRLNKSDSKKLNNILLKGGNLKFSIVESSQYSRSKYYFEIADASGYQNALNQLSEKK
jgi:hypothetical protein